MTMLGGSSIQFFYESKTQLTEYEFAKCGRT